MKTHQSTFQAQTIFYLINYIWLIIQRVQNTFVHLYFERSLLHWTSTFSSHFPRKILLFEFFLSAGAQEETDKSIPSIVAARVGTKPLLPYFDLPLDFFASSAGSIHGSASVITATDKSRGYESRYPPPSSTTKRTCPHPKACISNRGNLIARGTRRGRARGKKQEHDG